MANDSFLRPGRRAGLVAEALTDTRVVTINGARQAGKSTLARQVSAAFPGTTVRPLDDAATRRDRGSGRFRRAPAPTRTVVIDGAITPSMTDCAG